VMCPGTSGKNSMTVRRVIPRVERPQILKASPHALNFNRTTDNTTHYTNADGSSHEHEDINYSDSEGKRCDSDGLPMKESHTRDEDTDSKGNTKEHIEEIKEKNRKCVKWVWDREWDSKGKLVKENESTTEIPCSKYNLQVSFNGTKSSGNMTAVYGPNTIIIHLEDKGKIYEGKYESVLAGNVKGFCNGSITWPVLIEVTATKYEEKKELVFSVKTTMDKPWTPGTCKNLSGNMRAGAITVPLHLFRIAEEGGASFSVTEEPITWTYTLVQK
jgi:hypothetical protein